MLRDFPSGPVSPDNPSVDGNLARWELFVLFPFKTDYPVRKRKAKKNKLMAGWTMVYDQLCV